MKNKDLRQLMIKYSKSNIWNKHILKWNDNDKQDFDKMKKGTYCDQEVAVSKSHYTPFSIKVMRISDSLVYDSISECKRKNQFHNVEMKTKLDLGTEFKTI